MNNRKTTLDNGLSKELEEIMETMYNAGEVEKRIINGVVAYKRVDRSGEDIFFSSIIDSILDNCAIYKGEASESPFEARKHGKIILTDEERDEAIESLSNDNEFKELILEAAGKHIIAVLSQRWE